jgi:hypothetical protein
LIGALPANSRTRHALQGWLTQDPLEQLTEFLPVTPAPKQPLKRAPAGPQPIVIFLPGIMGSHLRVGATDRVWFDFFDIARGGLAKIQYGRPDIAPDGLFEKFYGDLCTSLKESHQVRRFAYDWRHPLQRCSPPRWNRR